MSWFFERRFSKYNMRPNCTLASELGLFLFSYTLGRGWKAPKSAGSISLEVLAGGAENATPADRQIPTIMECFFIGRCLTQCPWKNHKSVQCFSGEGFGLSYTGFFERPSRTANNNSLAGGWLGKEKVTMPLASYLEMPPRVKLINFPLML